MITEEYKVWKKNTPFLYDVVMTHALEWPRCVLAFRGERWVCVCTEGDLLNRRQERRWCTHLSRPCGAGVHRDSRVSFHDFPTTTISKFKLPAEVPALCNGSSNFKL